MSRTSFFASFFLVTALLSSHLHAELYSKTPRYTYFEFGPALIHPSSSIELDTTDSSSTSYSNLPGFRLAGSIQTDDYFFFDFNYTLAKQSKYSTELNIDELRAGIGGFFPFGPNKSTHLVGKLFYYGFEARICEHSGCSDFKEQGFGYEASLKQHLFNLFSLEAGVQYLVTDIESFPAYRLGASLSQTSGHGINTSAYITKDLPYVFTFAYRYTF